jgi:hypothetical protein
VGGGGFPLGPLVLEPLAPSEPELVEPSQTGRLCSRRLDWIEAVP